VNFEKVRCVQKDEKLIVTIDNPPVNALSRQVVQALLYVLHSVERRNDIKEIVFTGEGYKYFSAGADIRELKEVVESPDPFTTGYEFSRMGQELILRILTYPKTTTALINGYCFGGGFELALACKRREVYSHAWLGLPETTLGLVPGWGGLHILMFKFKPSFWSMMSLHIVDNKEFWGDVLGSKFFDRVIETDEILQKPPQRVISDMASRACNILCGHAVPLSNSKDRFSYMLWGVAVERELAVQFGLLCAHPDAKEGINAFLEKREPKFQKLRL